MPQPEKLPESVTTLLKSTRFIHLATSYEDIPHVSLMNYTYYHKNESDYIIISTPKGTTKYDNMVHNPNVSILIHDWISAKTNSEANDSPASNRRNSLYELLANFNKNEIGRVSVTISGRAEILTHDTEKDDYLFYKSLHLNNSKIDQVQAKNYIEDDDNALILVQIHGCKVTDTDNNVVEY
ncbi:predicted protein [Scheffersomyces stipitis CBS 6054]|uniref:Pyridoxamine 5'-phosphate oxidase N-terminal domain-containing protein n=1 Tax=Scheffersomyces stipitis (strain ATCC 58785 / CBS 6054 / NBRC 10063 / NRRL Y-11545) TaxID=322104 RepID=A3LVD9_PICST|nr:predicted protein [Scheffersomyces stipitis CBS 6054]ABN67102.1 predicted protein [Scheffersomyces stipitis CBS 6054]KAG2734643.1 hypothetical protein G9P44_002649 [Scheffersomyces stipitis]